MSDRSDIVLNYPDKWIEESIEPVNSLQVFMTDRCNLRCEGCFYAEHLGSRQMSLQSYARYLNTAGDRIDKVILLGGEPTLHTQLNDFVMENCARGLRTTIYTNGVNLRCLEIIWNSQVAEMVSIRVGVHGVNTSDKPLRDVKRTPLPVTIVYMLDRYNVNQLELAAVMAEDDFDCQGFYISSIREMDRTGDFWSDTDRTISPVDYAQIVQRFVDNYEGGLPRLHIATRGVLVTKKQDFCSVRHCRVTSVLGDGSIVKSPLDIGMKGVRRVDELGFGDQSCVRHNKCVLQKIVLAKK